MARILRLWLPVFLCAAPLCAQQDILLVTLDTTRTDHLSCYGYAQKTSPELDAFAKEAVRFTRGYTPAPYTLPAHATILTGLWPKGHGLRDNFLSGPKLSAISIASALQDRGYRTAAFVSSFVLDRRFGLDRGFAHYDDQMTVLVREDRERNERPAEETEKRVLEYLDGLPAGGRVFLWVHFYDPHYPYRPHPDTPPGMSAYDGEIRHMDASLGRVLRAWRERRRGLVVIAADHGESLGEHGEYYHGMFLYESCVRVPLLLRAEGTFRPGIDDRLAGLADVAATVLAFAGVPVPPMDGRSLLDMKSKHDRLYFESFVPANTYGWSPPFGVLEKDFKYIHLPKPELYDVLRDPGEKTNLADRQRAKAKALLGFLKKEYGMAYVPPEGVPDAETVRRLASLGYRGGSTARTGRDPKDLIWVIGDMFEAKDLAQRKQYALSEKLYRKVLAADPDNIPAQIEYSDLLKTMGRREEARAVLRGAVASNPRYAFALFNLAVLEYEDGDLEKARKEMDAFLNLDPADQDALLFMGKIALERRDPAQAEAYLAQAARIDATRADVYYFRGLLSALQKNPKSAAEDFSLCLKIRPDYWEALTGLGEALFQMEHVDESLQAYEQSLTLNPEQPQVYLTVGAIFLNAKEDRMGALAAYHVFLDRYPDRPEAERVREIVRDLAPAGP